METQIKNKYGREMRSIRAYLQLSQKQMAELLNVSQKTLSDYELGNSIPRADVWEHIKAMRLEQAC